MDSASSRIPRPRNKMMSASPSSPQRASHRSSASETSPTIEEPSRAKRWAAQLAETAAHTMKELTARKYTLPDKNVASQLLMYRQLLHTKCRPGLKLSRDYQGTPAQKAVKHMPWWAQGCEQTGKMVISYDNLIRRLWLHGGIEPFYDDPTQPDQETLLDQDGMPPVPHEYWVRRLGFQQTDPVTDFRSGGVLSLAMMVHIAESCPDLFQRFIKDGDASVLPFGITSINITDMLSKFLMLTKTVDRMDALLSQKPFWRMFADPNALTACQELCLDMLADVVVELTTERQYFDKPAVTVFDFSHILETTERRVHFDLLGAGPKTVAELYSVHRRLKQKYKTQLEQRINPQPATPANRNQPAPKNGVEAVQQATTELAAGATNLAGSMFQKARGFNPLVRMSQSENGTAAAATQVATEEVEHEDVPGVVEAAVIPQPVANADLLDSDYEEKKADGPSQIDQPMAATLPKEGGETAIGGIEEATEAVQNFTIGSGAESDDDL